MLDTNACVEYLRNRNQHVVRRIQSHAPADLSLCSVVLSELYYGAYKSPQQAANLALLQAFCPQFVSHPFDDKAAERAGQLRVHLEARGTPIGPNDLMIAAIALARGLTLVTHNTAEFGRVPGLPIEDWQIP